MAQPCGQRGSIHRWRCERSDPCKCVRSCRTHAHVSARAVYCWWPPFFLVATPRSHHHRRTTIVGELTCCRRCTTVTPDAGPSAWLRCSTTSHRLVPATLPEPFG